MGVCARFGQCFIRNLMASFFVFTLCLIHFNKQCAETFAYSCLFLLFDHEHAFTLQHKLLDECQYMD